MNLEELQKDWERLGREDPMWAVLSSPEKRGNKWDERDFFKSGREEIAAVLAEVSSVGRTLQAGTALDFGCGVGRLTQALAGRFEQVHGLDISPSMLEKANHYNQHGDKCRYHLNASADLRCFPDHTFDFVYSVLVLQHIPVRYELAYIREFIRVVKPGGVVVFQVLEPAFLRRLAPEMLVRIYRRWQNLLISLYGVSEGRATRAVQEAGGEILRVHRKGSGSSRWQSLRFFVTKADPKGHSIPNPE